MSSDEMTVIALLIVDDEPEITDELNEFFSLHGFRCFTAHSAQEAKTIFHKHPSIGIVLTDLHMPDLNGIDLIDQLKEESPASREFKAILFTARSEKDDIIEALRTGFTDYYPKPLDFSAVLKRVKQLYLKQQQYLARNEAKNINQNINQLSKQLETLQTMLTQQPDHKQPISKESAAALENLTPRQKEVAYLAADGLTNKQIASALSIQENTVKLYISQILKSTSLANRTQLSLLINRQR